MYQNQNSTQLLINFISCQKKKDEIKFQSLSVDELLASFHVMNYNISITMILHYKGMQKKYDE